jgi:hypothetical protein
MVIVTLVNVVHATVMLVNVERAIVALANVAHAITMCCVQTLACA